jgi:stage V sporulation protein D (sporulation-specific penicillin-binding protein)
MRSRAFVTFLVVALALTALVGRVGYLQFFRGKDLTTRAELQWMQSLPVEPARGVIYDRNGKELAISASADTVMAIPPQVTDPRGTAHALASILEMDEETIYERITRKVSAVYVKRKITQEQTIAIRELNLDGITFTQEGKRFYPYGSLASHALGFVGIDSQGLNGIELVYDEYLRGQKGEIELPRDAKGDPLPGVTPVYKPPVDGSSLKLTLDEVIQHVVERELDNALAENKATEGLVIAMDPNNGEVLGIASRPNYDPNHYAEYAQETWRNHAISDVFEPGSTFKIITMVSAMEEGKVQDSDRFYDPGYIKVADSTIHCWKRGGHGSETFPEIVQNSCNPGFVLLGQRVGAAALDSYIRKFGFDKKTGIDLNGEAIGILYNLPKKGPVELATTSFGQGPAVTPIQQVAAVAAVANGGHLVTPHLMKEIRTPDGQVVSTGVTAPGAQVISAATAAHARDLMESVVQTGSGLNAYLPGFRVAGKTGTAQVPRPGGGYYSDRYIASFIGFAPANDPKVVLYVAIRDPKGPKGYYGSQVAGPVFKAIMYDVLRYLNVTPQTDATGMPEISMVTVPNVQGATRDDALKALEDAGLNVHIAGDGPKVSEQTPKGGAQVPGGTSVTLSMRDTSAPTGKINVPDLIGMSMRAAGAELSAAGLKGSFTGTGRAVRQDPTAGLQVDVGATITVEFAP